MKEIMGSWPRKDLFLNFRCARCAARSRHVPSRTDGSEHLVQCPSCRSVYAAQGTFFFGLSLGVLATGPFLFLYFTLAPLLTSGTISPLIVLLGATALAIPWTIFIKPHLARLMVRYEYVGHAI